MRASALEFPWLSAVARAGQTGLQGLNRNNQPHFLTAVNLPVTPSRAHTTARVLFSGDRDSTIGLALAYRRDLQVSPNSSISACTALINGGNAFCATFQTVLTFTVAWPWMS